MPPERFYRGWGLRTNFRRGLKRSFARLGLSREARRVADLCDEVAARCETLELDTETGRQRLAETMAVNILVELTDDDAAIERLPLFASLVTCLRRLIGYEDWFNARGCNFEGPEFQRSALWKTEDRLNRCAAIVSDLDASLGRVTDVFVAMLRPLVDAVPVLTCAPFVGKGDVQFDARLRDMLADLPQVVEGMVQLPFVPELDEYATLASLRARLRYNLVAASGGTPNDPKALEKATRFPTKVSGLPPQEMVTTYLGGTPLDALFDIVVPIKIPQPLRFEHQHIVGGSGHGKTQTLQHFILSDLDAVAAGEATIVVIDSQRDLIENIAGLSIFAPGKPLHDRLCLIDPTDVEWPVALNLFDFGLERIDQYSQLDRERLINGVLELYDFVLGSLLDAGMTQKQTIIFRYMTRLLLHIPDATIHTFRELLEDGGLERHRGHVAKLSGSARSFFETEFQGKEFTQTRKQVLRRLYGILENQTFERMFSHPKSRLDLFAEMNAGKVILINTAKDLLKENGTEIFGRFFIAMIAQAAQERAVLPPDKRIPTFVYIDEANDYFDRNIGIILSQARKYNVGMVLAHQYLGQLEPKLQDAISANTAIKFAGGLSAKDARSIAPDLRTEGSFVEQQPRLSFAAFIKGVTKNAVSLETPPGMMEKLPRMDKHGRAVQREMMRKRYATHYTQASQPTEDRPSSRNEEAPPDDGEPMAWD